MKILQINNTDLPGKIFNGYDLQLALNERGISACQMVMDKQGEEESAVEICSAQELYVRNRLIELEQQLGMNSLLEPFANNIIKNDHFKNADIVHYHLLHNKVFSILDCKKMFDLKPSVWTIHDPWVVGGHCIHPLDCLRWKEGCGMCPDLSCPYPIEIDKTSSIWKIKKAIFSQLDCDLVVATDWMRDYIEKSPLMSGFKRIHKIPFGIHVERYENMDKAEERRKLGIQPDDIVIAFRAESQKIKGMEFIIEALTGLENRSNIIILTVGCGKLPPEIVNRYRTMEWGWQDEEGVCKCLCVADIFLMPSLAESFGLMAHEAMAAKCTVIVFAGTVLEQVAFAPQCGIAVPYKSAEGIKKALEHLIQCREELRVRGETGRKLVKQHYTFENYVNKHIELYENIYETNLSKNLDRRNGYVIFEKECKKDQMDISVEMAKIEKFKKSLYEIAGEKKICIFCVGNYGTRMYSDLKERLVTVDYVADNDRRKWGRWNDGLNCVGADFLQKEKDELLIIVANKEPQRIIEDLQDRGFRHIVTKQQIDELLIGVPKISSLEAMQLIEGLDYSDEGVKLLIDRFNKTIYGICRYYESKLQIKTEEE